ncbi:MAG: elongation factor P [Chloroflexota bacterium]
MTISYSELRRGTVIVLDEEPWQVVDWKHKKMQQRAPVLSLSLRNLRTGRAMERNVPGNQKLTLAEVDTREAQYLYSDGDHYHFMDMQTFEQYPLATDQMGDALQYLKEQDKAQIVFYRGEPIALEMPTYVELQVVDTPPSQKGNTAQGSTKPATLETGLMVNVPFFVNIGEVVRVDTRNGEYLERVG